MAIGSAKENKKERTGKLGRVLATAMTALALMQGVADAAPPVVSAPLVTDLATGSFAVVWSAAEPVIPALSLFAADCTTPLTAAVQTVQNDDATGLVRVTVSGLTAATGYCYQALSTGKVSGETATAPAQPVPVMTATTVSRTMTVNGQLVPFNNDLVRIPPVYVANVTAPPAAILTTLTLADGSLKSPLSLLPTQLPGDIYFNLNNLFDAASGSSRNLTGGERLIVREIHGKPACTIDRFRLVAPDNELTKAADLVAPARQSDIDANGRVNILDILRVAAGSGTALGSDCFNSDLDLNGDGSIEQNDLTTVEGAIDATL